MASIDTIADRSAGSTVAGKAYFETSTNKFIVYNGSSWVEIDSDGTGAFFSNQYSLSLDGSNDYVALASGLESAINNASTLTVSAWVKLNKWGCGIFSSGANDTNGIWLLPYSASTFYFTARNGGYDSISVNPSGNLTLNNWHHVCGVLDGANSKLYFDGSEAGSGTLPALGSTAGSNPSIGSLRRGSFFTGGLIDEVSIFNSALSASDVAALRDTTGSNPVPANISSLSPVGWWRMGDDSNDSATSGGSIATITDSSGNGNDATQATASSQPTFFDLTGETIYV